MVGAGGDVGSRPRLTPLGIRRKARRASRRSATAPPTDHRRQCSGLARSSQDPPTTPVGFRGKAEHVASTHVTWRTATGFLALQTLVRSPNLTIGQDFKAVVSQPAVLLSTVHGRPCLWHMDLVIRLRRLSQPPSEEPREPPPSSHLACAFAAFFSRARALEQSQSQF